VGWTIARRLALHGMDADSPATGPGPVIRGLPVPAPDDEKSSSAPSIPSFASLRDTRKRSPADLLVSRQDAAVEPVPPSPRPVATRPPEWADLWHLGLRVARWCVRQPLATARRLLC
jgi:hypothetical protein